MTHEQERRIRREMEFTLCALLFSMTAYYVVTLLSLDRSHNQILDTLCRMDYPECVMGVDR